MRIRNGLLITAFVVASGSVTPSVWAREHDETTVKLSDIPAAARDSLTREAKGSQIVRVEQEKQHGQMVYEGVIKRGNEETGIVVDASGKLLGRHSEKGEREHQRH
jgi:hypothetical protein